MTFTCAANTDPFAAVFATCADIISQKRDVQNFCSKLHNINVEQNTINQHVSSMTNCISVLTVVFVVPGNNMT